MVININTGHILIRRLHRADTFWKRFWGLLLHKKLPTYEGMLLTPCRSIHTFFMRFTIDVLYLDHSMRVVAAYPQVKPWRLLTGSREGRHVLEMSPGILALTGTTIGHQLQIINERSVHK